jgi:enoyl-[acyl-carrier protein] reductase I
MATQRRHAAVSTTHTNTAHTNTTHTKPSGKQSTPPTGKRAANSPKAPKAAVKKAKASKPTAGNPRAPKPQNTPTSGFKAGHDPAKAKPTASQDTHTDTPHIAKAKPILNPLVNALAGKRGLVVGIANEHSIAYGCAKAMRALGADLAVTYLNEDAEPYVRPLAESLQCALVLPCDLEKPGELARVFEQLTGTWGELDFVLHAVAYAPKDDLRGRVTDCSAEGFARAMQVSCHSFMQIAHLAEPLMPGGGTLLTLSFHGAERVVDHYGVMGPVKAALEATVRALAAELGGAGIRVHALSPGPILTRAASGIDHFDELLADEALKAPLHHLLNIDDVGAVAAGLVSDWARCMSGNVVFVDGGSHVMA